MINTQTNSTETSNIAVEEQLTFKDQISQFLNSDCTDADKTQAQYFFDGEPAYDLKYYPEKFTDLTFTFILEDSYGGESQGEQYWSIYKFTNGTDEVYVKFDGSYYSYSGSEYNEWFFVTPGEKTITVFTRTEP